MGQAALCQCREGSTQEVVKPIDTAPSAAPSFADDADPRSKKYWQSKTINVDKSTEDLYSEWHFSGENKDIRPLLDYTYHKKYKNDRVMFQDRLITDLCAGASQQDDLLLPWVIFTAGAMGAGKGFIIRFMEKNNYLPLKQFVIVDPDQIRQALPEWDAYVANDPELAAVRTQKEAGHVAEILGYKALRSRWNVIFDGSLRDVEWYKLYFAKLRHAFPGIRLMILHIQAERESVLRRAEERGRQTGRVVPRKVLEQSMEAVPNSVRQLAPHADVALKVMNLDNQEPRLEREEGAANPPEGIGATWEYVTELWKPIDSDGDGELSKAEVLAAVAQGILTETVMDTIDINGDGAISKEEFIKAKQKCFDSGSIMYRQPSFSKSSVELTRTRSAKWGAADSWKKTAAATKKGCF